MGRGKAMSLRSHLHIGAERDKYRSTCEQCGWRSSGVNRKAKAERLLRQHESDVHGAAGAVTDEAAP